MTIHYHGTPMRTIYETTGRHFCVTFGEHGDALAAHTVGQSVMLDNGAFTKWKTGRETNWTKFYKWSERWLAYPTTWAVIPDCIDGAVDDQDALIAQWPYGHKGAPVWHMNEPVTRLLNLCDSWPLVCIGSTGRYKTVLSPRWQARLDHAFNELSSRHRFIPRLHMLRGMQLCKPDMRWPFWSLDSTTVARGHWKKDIPAEDLIKLWDSQQCPPSWEKRSVDFGFVELDLVLKESRALFS